MAQGRCSAKVAAALVVVLSFIVLHSQVADSASFVVGGANGWTFNTASWPEGKTFAVGDTLVFNYNPAFHNVAAVSSAGYSSCNAPKDAKVFESGKDEIQLVKGQNFFICTHPGHCASGMKIAITV